MLGDFAVSLDLLSANVAAVIDNATHGFIGLCIWWTVTTQLPNALIGSRLQEIGLCGFFASVIDLDHFAAAKSLRLQVMITFQ